MSKRNKVTMEELQGMAGLTDELREAIYKADLPTSLMKHLKDFKSPYLHRENLKKERRELEEKYWKLLEIIKEDKKQGIEDERKAKVFVQVDKARQDKDEEIRKEGKKFMQQRLNDFLPELIRKYGNVDLRVKSLALAGESIDTIARGYFELEKANYLMYQTGEYSICLSEAETKLKYMIAGYNGLKDGYQKELRRDTDKSIIEKEILEELESQREISLREEKVKSCEEIFLV